MSKRKEIPFAPTPADTFCLAPLRGVTVCSFRAFFARWFTPPHCAISPFIPLCAGGRVRPQLLSDVAPERVQAIPLIPQLIGKDPDQMRVMLTALRGMGYEKANLNAGCPYAMVTKKGRGAGLLQHGETLKRVLEAGCELMPGGFSIKVRLGLDTPTLLIEQMEIINQFPLSEITIHARTARQMYEGGISLERFAEAMAASRHPVVYNGDINSLDDFQRLKVRFPSISRWMVGRGAIRDPFLFGDLVNQQPVQRSNERLHGFLREYLASCEEELYGPAPVLGRMKEMWSYLHYSMVQGTRLWQAIRTCRTVEGLRSITQDVAIASAPRSCGSRGAGYQL